MLFQQQGGSGSGVSALEIGRLPIPCIGVIACSYFNKTRACCSLFCGEVGLIACRSGRLLCFALNGGKQATIEQLKYQI